jgi:Ca-activated chloride channel family protein
MGEWLTNGAISGVQFMWPQLLWLLAIVPLGILTYLFVRRHEHASFASIGAGALICVGLSSLLLATARPKMPVTLPIPAEQLMVVLDISGSMSANDVKPTRFEVAKQTLAQLIDHQPKDMRVGLVTAAATATLIQPPTTDRDSIIQSLNTVSLQSGSALGSGILIGLAELIPSAGINVQALLNDSIGQGTPGAAPSWQPDPNVVRTPGSNRSVAMVLISDGDANVGPDLLQMAELAAQLGVRIYTVGIGTTEGAVVSAQGISQRVRLDQAVLSEVAAITIGTYSGGATSHEIEQIFAAVQKSISFEQRQTIEITAFLLLIGLLSLLAGMGSTFMRQGRIL